MGQIVHFLHVPFTGLGNFRGFRGPRWLKNRIQVFKQFVVPSLLAQTQREFILWVAWRREEKTNPQVKELKEYLDGVGLKNVFTYSGIAIWDDKYSDDIARERVIDSLHGSMGDLINIMENADTILMTLQPSDDCYRRDAVENIQKIFRTGEYQAVGYTKGFITDYKTLKVREWNPNTNPPFYTIKFSRETFIDPLKHFEYAAHKSHEYVPDKFRYAKMEERGFMVGVHGENISTVWQHPFTGPDREGILDNFGLGDVSPLKIKISIRKYLLRKLPYRAQRKLRYLAGEKQWIGRPIVSWIYDAIRS